MLSKVASSTIFLVFGMTRPGIEPRSPRPLANTLLVRPGKWNNDYFSFILLTAFDCTYALLAKGDTTVPQGSFGHGTGFYFVVSHMSSNFLSPLMV